MIVGRWVYVKVEDGFGKMDGWNSLLPLGHLRPHMRLHLGRVLHCIRTQHPHQVCHLHCVCVCVCVCVCMCVIYLMMLHNSSLYNTIQRRYKKHNTNATNVVADPPLGSGGLMRPSLIFSCVSFCASFLACLPVVWWSLLLVND